METLHICQSKKKIFCDYGKKIVKEGITSEKQQLMGKNGNAATYAQPTDSITLYSALS